MQRALVDFHVTGAVVTGQMLDLSHYALTLHATGKFSSHDPHQEGIFTESRLIAGKEGIAVDVDVGREQNVLAQRAGFAAKEGAVKAGGGRIKCGCERYRRRHCGGSEIYAHARRPIGKAKRRNTEPGNAWPVTPFAKVVRIGRPMDQRELFFQGHF